MPSGAVTFAVTVQLAEAASVAPERLIVPDPATAVAVPPQVEVKPLGVAITIPAGSVSVKATPVNAANEFGLLTVRLSDEVPPGTILFGVKVLLITGGERTVTEDDAVFPSRLWSDVTALLVFVLIPGVVPLTVTLKLQVAPPASVAPVRLITFVPGVAVIVPPPQDP